MSLSYNCFPTYAFLSNFILTCYLYFLTFCLSNLRFRFTPKKLLLVLKYKYQMFSQVLSREIEQILLHEQQIAILFFRLKLIESENRIKPPTINNCSIHRHIVKLPTKLKPENGSTFLITVGFLALHCSITTYFLVLQKIESEQKENVFYRVQVFNLQCSVYAISPEVVSAGG